MERRRLLAPSFPQVLAFCAVALPVVVALRLSMSTIDLAYLIRAGEVMLDAGHVLRTDPFTFTMHGQPWLNQQWGSDVVFALLYRAGGWELIALVRAALAGVTFWLVYRACRERGASVRTAAWLTLSALLVSFHALPPRPQLFAFTLFALTLWLVARRERHPAGVWVLPVVALAWANLHGSFFLVPLVAGIAWAEDVRLGRPGASRLALAGVASIAAAFANPFGGRAWVYVWDLSTDPVLRRTILEWRPPSLATSTGAFFAVSVLLVAIVAFRRRRELGWVRIAALAVFFLVGATAVRGIIWWALAGPVLIADLFPAHTTEETANEPGRPANAAIVAVLVVLGIVFLPWFRPTFASTANSATVADGLLAHSPNAYSSRIPSLVPPGTRLFVPEIWASWFELALPDYPVMVDPRIELFLDTVWDDFDQISNGEGDWQAVVDRWDIGVLVLSTEQQDRLIAVLGDHPGWDLVYEDHDGMLLVRSQ